ncbi:glucosidase II beta subunit-like-domain-containing protein [Phycomyces blakesleeanus]|uniref:Glucosidase 2 subunit beta n=1 Tax=Phycomyces blakesleeanus TaxID=4837 RepID=A0ABR3AY69_PHYBL
MVKSTLLLSLPCVLAAVTLVRGANPSMRGISPEHYDLYAPLLQNGESTWKCLDKSKTIHYSAINDDYCDCPDGSDEPGTSACPNSLFYCENKDHIPAYIKSFAVNDGVCDQSCCDGSDEFNGLTSCPNICKQVSIEFKKYQAELNNIQSVGILAKQKLLDAAEVIAEGWLQEKAVIQQEIDFKYADLDNLKRELEILEKAQIKHTPIEKFDNAKTIKQARKIALLQRHILGLQDDIDVLVSILHDLKNDHNHNYHDMAVKSAISGYDEFIETYEDYKTTIEKDLADIEDSSEDFITDEYEVDEAEADVPENSEDELSSEDVAAKEGNTRPKESLLNKVVSVLPSGLKTRLDKLLSKENADVNESTVKSSESALESTRKAYDDLNSDISNQEQKLENINEELSKDYGHNREWLTLKDVCVEKNEGEYTYSLCILGTAYQKSNKDSSRTNLGRFEKFAGTVESGAKDRYHEHLHSHGTRCWNGPERSVRAFFECGAETEILEVSEPEKCEYHFRMRSPAVCETPHIPSEDKDVKLAEGEVEERLHLHEEL